MSDLEALARAMREHFRDADSAERAAAAAALALLLSTPLGGAQDVAEYNAWRILAGTPSPCARLRKPG